MKRAMAVGVGVVLLLVAYDIGRLSGIFEGLREVSNEDETIRKASVSEVKKKGVTDEELKAALAELGIGEDGAEGVWRRDPFFQEGPVVAEDGDVPDVLNERLDLYFIRGEAILGEGSVSRRERELLGEAVRLVLEDLKPGAVVVDADVVSANQISPVVFVRRELELTERVREAYERLLLGVE